MILSSCLLIDFWVLLSKRLPCLTSVTISFGVKPDASNTWSAHFCEELADQDCMPLRCYQACQISLALNTTSTEASTKWIVYTTQPM